GCPLNSGHAAIPLRDVRDIGQEAPNLLGRTPDHDTRFEVHRFLSARCNPSESARRVGLPQIRGLSTRSSRRSEAGGGRAVCLSWASTDLFGRITFGRGPATWCPVSG